MEKEKNLADQNPKFIAIIGISLLFLAIVTWFDGLGLSEGLLVGTVGPAAVLNILSVFFTILGVSHLIVAYRGFKKNVNIKDEKVNKSGILWLIIALLGFVFIIFFGGGFIIGGIFLFCCTFRAFNGKFTLNSLLIGLLIVLIFYTIFSILLKLTLPQGLLETYIRSIIYN